MCQLSKILKASDLTALKLQPPNYLIGIFNQ